MAPEHRKAAIKGWKRRAHGMTPGKDMMLKRHWKRSQRARDVDHAKRARHTYTPDQAHGRRKWHRNPDEYDMKGLDDPEADERYQEPDWDAYDAAVREKKKSYKEDISRARQRYREPGDMGDEWAYGAHSVPKVGRGYRYTRRQRNEINRIKRAAWLEDYARRQGATSEQLDNIDFWSETDTTLTAGENWRNVTRKYPSLRGTMSHRDIETRREIEMERQRERAS